MHLFQTSRLCQTCCATAGRRRCYGSSAPTRPTTNSTVPAVWISNPFTFAVQPGSGRLFLNDVGEARWEEINEGAAGANYGWPYAEGPGTDPKYRHPLHAYDRSVGKSIAGGTFYDPPIPQFPKEYVGKYFFADFIDNYLQNASGLAQFLWSMHFVVTMVILSMCSS